MLLMQYVELHCRSNFSFLQGASHPEELCDQAAALGYAGLAITDHNSLAGAVRMHLAAKDRHLRLIVGAEIVPEDAPPLVMLPTDRIAYGRLARLITRGRRRMPKGECRILFEDVAELAEGSIGIVLEGPSASRSGDGPGGAANRKSIPPEEERIARYRDAFGDRLYLAAEWHREEDFLRHAHRLMDLSGRTRVPLVAANDVHYHVPERRRLHDVLTCIREHCTLAAAGRRLRPNAERHLRPLDEIRRLYAALPGAIERTAEIAERCRFSLDQLRYEYPRELCPAGRRPIQFLRELTWAGARERFGDGLSTRTKELIEHELRLIEELHYEPFFLTVWDLVRFARSRGILCQGRGSAANSAVCYCLGITAVDPERIELLFERFVSRERNEPPDIDVDFEHERREEVFQYIYRKYGRDRAGLAAEVITYRPRSAVRDVGKALGFSLDRVDVLAKNIDWWDREPLSPTTLREAGLNPDDPTVRCLVGLVREILGFPRHLSQHVGGFVITEGPLCEMVPILNGAMPDRTFIEWDKDDIDALGILKVDCLALGMLTCLQKCFRLLRDHAAGAARTGPEGDPRRLGGTDEPGGPCRPIEHAERPRPASEPRAKDAASDPERAARGLTGPGRIGGGAASRSSDPVIPGSLLEIPPEDPAVYEMLSRADSIGVFQVESRAQMSMLPRLRPRCFYDLVIEVAIVRPGPIQGGMVHPYLRRRNGQEAIVYPSPAIQSVLGKTLGVPLFQEQAMRLAVVAAGFTPGEADRLRRAMGAWRRPGIIESMRDRLIRGMLERGLPRQYAEQVFEQIRGFGEYGFPESHAASFALLVYASAWLKLYYPAAFAAALLNSQPMGFYAPAQIVGDARQHGVEVRGIDVNHSGYDCTLEEVSGEPRMESASKVPGSEATREERTRARNGTALRLGMRLIRGVPQEEARRIEQARREAPFRTIAELARRAEVGRGTLARLAGANAFGSLGLGRREALWEILALHREEPLLAGLDPEESRPKMPDMSLAEQVTRDYDTTGLSLVAHPIGLVRTELRHLNVMTAAEVQQCRQGVSARVAGLVLVRQRPGTASGVVFATLEDETGITNVILRPNVYERFRAAARGFAWVAEGRVEKQGQVVHLQALRISDLSGWLERVRVRSRDFH